MSPEEKLAAADLRLVAAELIERMETWAARDHPEVPSPPLIITVSLLASTAMIRRYFKEENHAATAWKFYTDLMDMLDVKVGKQ